MQVIESDVYGFSISLYQLLFDKDADNLSFILESDFSPVTHLLIAFSHYVLQAFKSFSYMVSLQSRRHLKAVLPKARGNFRLSTSRVKMYFFLPYFSFEGCGRGSKVFGLEGLYYLYVP